MFLPRLGHGLFQLDQFAVRLSEINFHFGRPRPLSSVALAKEDRRPHLFLIEILIVCPVTPEHSCAPRGSPTAFPSCS
jgi:hypothetical protein